MINININGQLYIFEDGISLADALTRHDIRENGIAVALNRKVVMKNEWQTTRLHDNDSILIISAVCGG